MTTVLKLSEEQRKCRTISSRMNTSSYYGNKAIEEGRKAGKDTMSSRSLTMA